MKNKRGFTLTEIITVMIILGVLATLAIPNLSASIERTKIAEGINILNALLSAQRICFFENNTYTTNMNQLDVTIPPPSNFNPPSIAGANANRVASVRRIGGGYTLCVNASGVLSCAGTGSNCVAVGVPGPVAPATCSNS